MAQQSYNNRAREAEGLTQGEAIGIAIAVGWMIVIGIFFWLSMTSDSGNGDFALGRWVLIVIAVFVPAGLIWIATLLARTARHLREDLYLTQAEVQRLSVLAKQQAATPVQPQTVAPQPAPEPEATQPSSFTSKRELSRLIVPRAAPQAPSDQPALALETPPDDENPPINRPDFIMALNFPDDENDTAGFAALRRALRDRSARKLVQASQDVLTLLSQDGIYMDDLRPEPATADLWRQFAEGVRGKDVDPLGGVKDQTYLSLVSTRTREDTIFRDSVHHFLRCFDQMLVSFEPDATDTDLLALAETRTARAFMLLGRSTGTFD